VAGAGWVPDDSHQAFRHATGFGLALVRSAAADLGPDDCWAELMEAYPHGPEADWAARIPGGCSEPADLPLDDSAARMADDHCALEGPPALAERSAGSPRADSAVLTMGDHCAPAVHPALAEHSAGSARADSAVLMMGDHCAPAVHPALAEHSAGSPRADSVVLMMGDHCAPAVHSAPVVRSVRADSVAAGCSADWLRGDC
jgi:hypothetical protein